MSILDRLNLGLSRTLGRTAPEPSDLPRPRTRKLPEHPALNPLPSARLLSGALERSAAPRGLLPRPRSATGDLIRTPPGAVSALLERLDGLAAVSASRGGRIDPRIEALRGALRSALAGSPMVSSSSARPSRAHERP